MNKTENGYAKVSNLQINKKRLDTPTLFFGQPIGGTPNPWEFFDVDGILLNAYHLLKKKIDIKKIVEKKSINNYLNAKTKNVIMFDSGGFLFQKRSELNFDCRKILDIYRKTKPDIGVILDHPFSPILSEEENVNERWTITLENTRIMLREEKNIVIFPVIHGYSKKQIERSWLDVKGILDEFQIMYENKLIIGIGSLVPLMMTSQGVKNGKTKIVDLIIKLRHLIPKAHIHAFGIGGATTALIMFYLGIDSLDSVSWRIKAANGAIQLPGVGDRFIKPPQGRLALSRNEEKLLLNCSCPICEDNPLKRRKFLLGPKAQSNFENRAIHNAWTYQNEIKECRKAIKDYRFEEFIRSRLKNSLMKSMFKYAVNVLTHKKLDLYN